MMTIILILTVLNSIGIGFYFLQKLDEKFCIVKREVYDALLDYWGQYHDEDGKELNHELAGGVGTPYYGFFQDYIDNPDEGEEEDE